MTPDQALDRRPLARTREATSRPMAAHRRKFFARLTSSASPPSRWSTNRCSRSSNREPCARAYPARHTKNLFLMDRDGAWSWSSPRTTPRRSEARCQAARLRTPELRQAGAAREVLGVTPGSVTPFALINDRRRRVRWCWMPTLLAFAEVNCHPLENTATTRLATEDLLRFIRACGHEPLILSLSGTRRSERLRNGPLPPIFPEIGHLGVVTRGV